MSEEIISRFSGLLDLKNPLKEVKDKLIDTYIELNGEIVLFSELILVDGVKSMLGVYKIDSLTSILPHSIYVEKIDSLNLFLPEAGNYPIPNGGFINVQKRPNRQYARSLKLENYKFYFFNDQLGSTKIHSYLPLLTPEKRETISVSGNNIYYLTTQIGFFTKEKDIMCTNELFEQELLEWGKQHENI
jgi:hypothetical protein